APSGAAANRARSSGTGGHAQGHYGPVLEPRPVPEVRTRRTGPLPHAPDMRVSDMPMV
ncbi:unnamed protein product, partial [Pylaiella littoralis]